MRNVLNLNFIQCSEDRLLLCQAYVTQSAYNKYLTGWLWSTCITACWCYVSELGIYDKTWTKIRTSSTTTVSCVCLCISYRLWKAEPKDRSTRISSFSSRFKDVHVQRKKDYQIWRQKSAAFRLFIKYRLFCSIVKDTHTLPVQLSCFQAQCICMPCK